MLGASDKVMQLINHEPKIKSDGGVTLMEEEVEGVIEFRDVRFTYPCRDDVEVLKGISFELDPKKNRVIALCGTSGCGKSSTISLVERFYDPDHGQILFNGTDVKELNPRWYHR